MNERIKELRKALGFTQQEFADRLNIKRGSLANYEIGRNEPIDAVISLICREFNVNETWLRAGYGEMFNKDTSSLDAQISEVIKSLGLDGIAARFTSSYLRLSESDQNVVKRFIQSMLDKQKAFPAGPEPALDPIAEIEKLKRQNQEILEQNRELAARMAAMEEEEAEAEHQAQTLSRLMERE